MTEIIRLLHTNDIHSHLERWPKIRRWLHKQQKEIREAKENYLTVDLGDFLDRDHPLTEATNGIANVQLMNQAHYDYVTIGNNEGVTNSKDKLNHLYDEANFNIVLGNLYDRETGELPSWASLCHYHETKEGTRLAFIGLTAPMYLSYHPFGWIVVDPIKALEDWLDIIKEQADVVILLSHLGLPEDKKIARLFPDIDVIIGAHTHHLLEAGQECEGTLLAAAGRFGEYVGEITLEIKDGKLISKIATTFDTNTFVETREDKEEGAAYLEKGKSLLAERYVTTLHESMSKESLMKLTLRGLKKTANCDVSILNTGLFLTKLESGVITEKDLHECLPHPMNIIKVTLLGRDLKRMVLEMEKNREYLRYFHVVGMKFRGQFFGDLWYDGLTYLPETRDVLWLGDEIDLEIPYSFVTVDHLAFLPFFPSIELAGDIDMISSRFLRNEVSTYLKSYMNHSEKVVK